MKSLKRNWIVSIKQHKCSIYYCNLHLYKNSEIYVLDEPTASLDPIKEKKIFNDIIKLSKGHTTLFISHRMSLTNNSDFIYVLDSGNIVKRGTHASLMRKRALYYKMYKAQQNYFKK